MSSHQKKRPAPPVGVAVEEQRRAKRRACDRARRLRERAARAREQERLAREAAAIRADPARWRYHQLQETIARVRRDACFDYVGTDARIRDLIAEYERTEAQFYARSLWRDRSGFGLVRLP